MLEIISALTPFLLLGLVAAGLSRLSGVALSMVVVPTLLIWGATAVDVIAFMLLFVVYNNFTMETQDIRLDYKDLVLFPKWRLCIPFILSLVSAFFVPSPSECWTSTKTLSRVSPLCLTVDEIDSLIPQFLQSAHRYQSLYFLKFSACSMTFSNTSSSHSGG